MSHSERVKVKEKDITAWIFKRFNTLSEPNVTAQQRDEILYRVFSMLSKCDKSWQCQLDILDVFCNILLNKPEILFGCSTLLDLILDFIETLQTENGNNQTESAILCKLCHLISIVGISQLNVCALTRILSLLRDSLLNKNKRSLAPLLLSTLKEMISVAPPSYQQNHLSHSAANHSSKNSSPSTAMHKKNKKSGNVKNAQNAKNESISWMASPQKIISNKIFNRWFKGDAEPTTPPKVNKEKRKKKFVSNNAFSSSSPNTLTHLIHRLPLSSFAFSNVMQSEQHKECCIEVPMKYIKKWPYSQGFTFICWISYNQYHRGSNSWMTIFSMKTTSGYGIHISLCSKSGSIKIRCTAKNVVDEKIIPKARLLASTWYFIGITHCQNRTAALRLLRPSHINGQCKVYINGAKIASIDIEYPIISEKPKYCSIAKDLFPSSLNTSSSSSFCGQLGAIYFFGNPLTTNQVQHLYSFGANYLIKPEIVKQSNPNWIMNTLTSNLEANETGKDGKRSALKRTESDLLLNNASLSSVDVLSFSNPRNNASLSQSAPISMQTSASNAEIEIFNNLMFSYHPLAVELSNKLCLNVGNSIYLHGSIHGEIEIYSLKNVRNIFHCSVGGLLSLFPILTVIKKTDEKSDELIAAVIDLLSQLIHFSFSNQIQMERSSAIPSLAFLLSAVPSKFITRKVLTSISNFCCHLSWLGFEDEVNSKATMIEDTMLMSHLPPSLSTSAQFDQIRPNMNISNTKQQHNLFNQSVHHLLLNFKIWHRDDLSVSDNDEMVENKLIDILKEMVMDQPRYMYQLMSIGVLLNEIRHHYSYKTVNEKHRNKKKKYLWLWNVRQRWFNIIIHLIRSNLSVDKHQRHSSSLEHIDTLIGASCELTESLESSEMMEILCSLLHRSENDVDDESSAGVFKGLFMKKADGSHSAANSSNHPANQIANHLIKLNCIKIFGVLFREQCVTVQNKDYLQVCCLHLINKLNLHREEEENFVVSLVSSFLEKKFFIPLCTYHAFLEIILYKEPGSIGVKHGTEFSVKKHELIQSQHYIEHLQNALIKYPQSLIQLLRCKFSETSDDEEEDTSTSEKVKLKTVLQDIVSLLAASQYNKENASQIVAFRGFQEPFIKLIDFCNVSLQSDTDSLSWFAETCLDLLLIHSIRYDNRGWKILRDTLRLYRCHCTRRKISLIYCTLHQIYLFVRILKRLSSCMHQDIELHALDNDNNEPFDTNIVVVNLVRSLELIEILIYELPPGLFSFKIDDWVKIGDEDEDEKANLKSDDVESKNEENDDPNEISPKVMDEIWALLCSSILSAMESLPKCNFSPSKYKSIASPPLKTGSPFRVLLRLLLSCLERNIESAKQTASIKSLIQNALQYLTVEQHPSIKYIGSLSFVVRRFHGEEMNNQFTIFLVKSLHDIFSQTKNNESKHCILKLIEFIVKCREPVSFVPIEMFFNCDDNAFLTCMINNGELFASLVDQAKNQKLTHLAIPITSKLLTNNERIYSKDMGFLINASRFRFTQNNAKSKKIEIMIMERVNNDIRANVKFVSNLNFVNFEKGNVEILEDNATRKLLERMDNRQRNYLEYYQNLRLKESDALTNYSYAEANRQAYVLNHSEENLKRGKMYWLENKMHIFCQGSVWYDESEETKKHFWQMDSWQNKHKMRLKLIEYHGGLIKTRRAGDSHSSVSRLNSNLNHMHNLTQSIANLDEFNLLSEEPVECSEDEEISVLKQEEKEEAAPKDEDEWDYCESHAHTNYELEDMILHQCDEVLLITPIGSYLGEIKITRSYLQFIGAKSREKYEKIVADDEKRNSEDKSSQRDEKGDRIIYSLPSLNKIRLNECSDKYIALDQIHAVFRRRYQLQHSALEVFTVNGASYFFELGNKQNRNNILKVLFSHAELKGACPLINKLFSRKPTDILRESDITQRWKRRELSNFDYLMLLNSLAGRTYNDINQYFVFPWVLTDFISPVLDLSNRCLHILKNAMK